MTVQVALALVLLISSGLMIRSFQTLRNVDPGFVRPEQVQTVRFGIPQADVKEAERVVRIEQAVLDKVAAIPGVESVGLTSKLPLDGDGWHDPIYAEDHVYGDSQLPSAAELQDCIAGAGEGDGEPHDRGAGLHMDRPIRQAAGGDGDGESWRAIVGGPAECGGEADSRREGKSRRGAKWWVW